MNLGIENKMPEPPSTPASPEMSKVRYPGFNIDNEKASDFIKEYGSEVGMEFSARVKCRIAGIRHDNYGKSVSVEVVSIDDVDSGDGKSWEKNAREALK